jgi:hypothetical protein
MKAKIFKVSFVMFIQMFTAGIKYPYKIEKDTLPADARVIDIKYNAFDQTIDVLIESDKFEEIMPGNKFLHIMPVATRL